MGLSAALFFGGAHDLRAEEPPAVITSPEYIADGVTGSITDTARNLAMSTLSVADLRPLQVFTFAAEEPQPCPVSKELEAYISKCNPRVDAFAVALLLTENGNAHDIDPWLLASIARYESTYRVNARGLAGELGLLQIHPCHKRRMREYGLDFGNEADRVWFGCHMLRERLDSGADMYTAMRPWSVRPKAWRLYRSLRLQSKGDS